MTVVSHQRRGQAVVDAIESAAQQALEESGPQDFSVARVAVLAQVHPTSIYRRWPTREALLADVLLSRTRGEAPVPDTGDLQADLSTFLAGLTRYLASGVGEAALRLSGTPECPREFRDEFVARRLGDLSGRLDRDPDLAALSDEDRRILFYALIGPVQSVRHWADGVIDEERLSDLVRSVLGLGRTWAAARRRPD
jgi:AcrR family transcriptional regulator